MFYGVMMHCILKWRSISSLKTHTSDVKYQAGEHGILGVLNVEWGKLAELSIDNLG